MKDLSEIENEDFSKFAKKTTARARTRRRQAQQLTGRHHRPRTLLSGRSFCGSNERFE